MPQASEAQQTAAQAAAHAAAALADFNKKKKKKQQQQPATASVVAGVSATKKINISQDIGKWKASQVSVVMEFDCFYFS